MRPRRLLALCALVLVAGCETLSYYRQAIGGHLQIMAAARPVQDWLADPGTPPDLRERLRAAQVIREFASRSLGLPDNGSYRAYADIGRPYVVWNVFAAPEFSVNPKLECFLLVGCVSYRGFFSEEAARRHAGGLREAGYDVYVGGVVAYSTLGWFDDPLLSSFIRYPDAQLARLIFHELAHQLVYARDDTTFNESFAVVVEEAGVRRWLESAGRADDLERFRATQARRREFAARIRDARERLRSIYASGASKETMLEQKRGEFDRLRASFGPVVPAEPSNAFLLAVALYNELVPGFERLLAQSGSLERFYERVRALAATERSSRDPLLGRTP
ncbi:MAG: aminopeptidase [Betaproteobacteria bacterium]